MTALGYAGWSAAEGTYERWTCVPISKVEAVVAAIEQAGGKVVKVEGKTQ